uniref:CCHC-type domain-containing protein n=1 Tax=Chenopodium quinoa TaxID=63459 RepID=A0A803N1L7_CHEQI
MEYMKTVAGDSSHAGLVLLILLETIQTLQDQLVKEWENLKLTEEENFVLERSNAMVDEDGPQQKLALSLVGKLLTKKTCNVEAMKRVLKNLWRIDENVAIRSSWFAREVGDCIGECIEVDESYPLGWDEYMRVKGMVNINKPLRRGIKVVVDSGHAKWVSFKYERLGDFCYYCGHIGHNDKDCDEKNAGSGDAPIVFQYGPFLTSSPHRLKVPAAERE